MHEDIIELRLDGLGYKAIAKKLGLTRDKVRDVCRRNGLGGIRATSRLKPEREYEKICACCGKTFLTTSAKAKYCCEECRKKAAKDSYLKYKAKKREQREPIECPVCGKTFIPRNSAQKRCSKHCYEEYQKELRKEQYEKDHGQQKSFCICCGKEITGRLGRKFCSRACGKAYRGIGRKYKLAKTDRLQEAVAVDKTVKLHTLILRDNNVCQICGKPCNLYDYEVTASGVMLCGDRYPTIDHIFPCSKGGSHTWDNVQLACLKCNREKRDTIEV